MKYPILAVSVEGTKANMYLLDEMITKLVVTCLDRTHGQVVLKSMFENGNYHLMVLSSFYNKTATPIALNRILTILTQWDKVDPQFFIDFSTGGPLLISPMEEFIEMITPEYGEVVLPEDLEQV